MHLKTTHVWPTIAALIAPCQLTAIALAKSDQTPQGAEMTRMRAWVAEGEERD